MLGQAACANNIRLLHLFNEGAGIGDAAERRDGGQLPSGSRAGQRRSCQHCSGGPDQLHLSDPINQAMRKVPNAQALVGAQPLIIMGTSEPFVLIYKFAFDFLKDRGRKEDFVQFAAWGQVWAAVIIFLTAALNASDLEKLFTRFVNETFGLLIAALLVSEGIRGLANEFTFKGEADDDVARPWKLVNGLWNTMLAMALLFFSLVLAGARRSVLLNRAMREFLSDYGAFLCVILVTLLSFSITGTPGDIPRRSQTKQAYSSDVRSNWSVFEDMGSANPDLIGMAFVMGVVIALLTYINHIISAKLCQQEDFGMRKPVCFAWDFMLVAVLLVLSGLFGGVPTIATIPQSPLHTKSLMNLRPMQTSFRRIRESIMANVKHASRRAGKTIRRTAGWKKKKSGSSHRSMHRSESVCVFFFSFSFFFCFPSFLLISMKAFKDCSQRLCGRRWGRRKRW